MSTGRSNPKICTNNCRFCHTENDKMYCKVATAGKDMKYTNYYSGVIPIHVLLFLKCVGCDAYQEKS